VLFPCGLPCAYIPVKQWKHLCGSTSNWIRNWSRLKPTKKEKKKENSFIINQFLDPVLYAAAQMLVLAQEDDAEAKTKGRGRPRCWKLECNIRRPFLSSLCLQFCSVNNLWFSFVVLDWNCRHQQTEFKAWHCCWNSNLPRSEEEGDLPPDSDPVRPFWFDSFLMNGICS